MKERTFMQKFFGTNKPEPQKEVSNKRVMSFNRDTGLESAKYDYSQPYINELSNNRWIPFGVDNLYPYVLLEMFNSSPFHAAIVDFKTKVLLSGGLDIKMEGNDLESKLQLEKIKLKLTSDFMEQFVKEYLIHQRINFFVTNKPNGKSLVEFVGSEKIRVANVDRGEKGYYYSRDWRKRRGNGKEEYIPSYDPFNKKEVTQLKTFQTLSPGQDIYAIPSYASAANWIWLDGQIAFFQKQNIENSINPSAVVTLFKTFANEEEEREFVNSLTSSFSSARNAGKVMVFVTDDPVTAPKIDITEPNKLDKAFGAVQTNIVSNVAYAHLINPALMGIATQGKLGVTQELIDAFRIFNNVYVKPIQRTLSEYLTELLKIQGIKATVTIKNNNKFLIEE